MGHEALRRTMEAVGQRSSNASWDARVTQKDEMNLGGQQDAARHDTASLCFSDGVKPDVTARNTASHAPATATTILEHRDYQGTNQALEDADGR